MLADQQQMFALNLFYVVGAVIVLVVLFLFLLAAWTAAKAGLWQLRRKHADDADAQRKLQPDGQPYPPASRGLCDHCRKVYETVYHLPSGRRRCPACYAEALAEEDRATHGSRDAP